MVSPIPDFDSPSPDASPAETEALDWWARCNRGLSATEEAEFEAWLSEDRRNAAAFNELDGTWEMLREAGDGRGRETNGGAARQGRTWPKRFVQLAAAIVVAAAVGVAYLSWWRPAHFATEMATPVGGFRTMRLPDGSVLLLNTDSIVQAEFGSSTRRVKLVRGEAHFTVAPAPARPFVVEAGGISVRALGTAFNVRLESNSVEVLVTSGKVQVEEALSGGGLAVRSDQGGRSPAPVLVSGQQIVVALPDPRHPIVQDVSAQVVMLPADESRRRLAWQARRLDFVAAPLMEIVGEFNRYNEHKLVIDDPSLARKRFGGSFDPKDEAGFLRMLRENFGVVIDDTGRGTVLRSSNRPAPAEARQPAEP